MRLSLEMLAGRAGTDKLSHGFIPYYAAHLDPRRDLVKLVLEVGIHEGRSLSMWRDYFENATVVGWDITSYEFNQFGRGTITQVVDQSSIPSMIRTIAANNYRAESFDLIIDDGSHRMLDQQITLATLWPLLRRGGIYIVEDLHTSLPHNPAEWEGGGCRDDFSNSTLRALQALAQSGELHSVYVEEEKCKLISAEVATCLIYDTRGDERHITSVIRKL